MTAEAKIPSARGPVVECIDCAALPAQPEYRSAGDDYRPRCLRRIDPRSTPRRPRCTTHWRRARDAERDRSAAANSRRRSGLDEDTRQQLLAIQGGKCPCGRPGTSGKRRVPSADHDHELARLHDHPEQVACRDCMRGFLCHRCNRDIIGLLYADGSSTEQVIATLRALADYLYDPPMRRLDRAFESVTSVQEVLA